MQTEFPNLQSTSDYPRASLDPEGQSGKTSFRVSECKPTDDPGIYLSRPAAGRIQPSGP